jgi:hypothetical protein
MLTSIVLLLGVNALQWWAASRDQSGGRLGHDAPVLGS